MKYKFICLTLSFLCLVNLSLAEELSAPPKIFALENYITPADSFLNNEKLSELNDNSIAEDTSGTLDDTPKILEEKPYNAVISLVNRRTNILTKLTFNQQDNIQIFENLNINVTQCLKNYNHIYGNDIAFIEISDEQKNVLFSSWIFKQYPSVAVFEHPIFSLALVSCS